MEAFFHLVESHGRWISLGVLLLLLWWESLSPFFGFFLKHGKDRTVHAVRNIVLGAVNAGLISVVFVAAWLWAAEWAFDHRFGLLYLYELPAWAHALCAVLLFDIWTYWWHRMNHRIPFLWRFHRVHHSDFHMDVTTANRFHIGEIFISSTLRILVILLAGAKLWHLALYESIMFPIVQFHHANVGVGERFDRFLRVFIVTPAMHKVHHSRFQPETDSNYTSMLSIWDRVFGSFRLRQDPHEIDLGLDGYDDSKKQTLKGLLRTPLDK